MADALHRKSYEGIERKSLRDAIFREVASNLMIHREFTSGVPARLIVEYGRVTTYNASRPHGFGLLNPATFSPYPKNPVIAAFFREIDRADELGSGMRNLMKYGKRYGGADPQLIEGDVFRMIISVPEFDVQPEPNQRPAKSGARVGLESGQNSAESGPSGARVGLESGPSQEESGRVRRNPAESGRIRQSRAKSGRVKEKLRQTNLLVVLNTAPLSKSEIAAALGLNISGTLNARIRNMLTEELIEYTIPDKPNSRLQKYRLTEKGRALLPQDQA